MRFVKPFCWIIVRRLQCVSVAVGSSNTRGTYRLWANQLIVGLLWGFVILFLVACGRRAEPVPTAIATSIATATATAIDVATATSAPTPQTVVVQRAGRPTAQPGQLAQRTTPVALDRTLPLLAAHLADVRLALTQPVPVLRLPAIDAQQERAQTLALQDARFVANLYDPQNGRALRNEVFGIYPVRPSDVTAESANCATHTCYRVEMYNYALNMSTVAVVDLDDERVLSVNHLLDAQPDIPAHLTQIAQEIAANAPEVATALGVQPDAIDATMANIKTALNASRCERSSHLCVAPTFIQDGRALWAIVDLTEGTVVGVRWTDLGAVAGTVTAVTEKLLQDEVVTALYCEKSNRLSKNGWDLDYMLTSSDGLLISDVRFGGQPILRSAKLVDWHVSYSNTDGFGYSDAIGCPMFSQAAVVAFNGPQIESIYAAEELVGFALTQDYKSEVWPAPCNYYYSQRYEFYDDGRFRIAFANHGRGCGDNGTYRPVVRIAPAGPYTFAAWDGTDWQPWQVEQWSPPFAEATTERYQFLLRDATGQGFAIVPGQGQFDDGGRGDNPYVYVTRRHEPGTGPDEGESDLITIGPCCNTDYQQGPEKFIDTPPETLESGEVVMWYVAQMKNDATPGQEYCWADALLQDGVYVPVDYPCFAGPMFVPIE